MRFSGNLAGSRAVCAIETMLLTASVAVARTAVAAAIQRGTESGKNERFRQAK